jgi:hypothetical protein
LIEINFDENFEHWNLLFSNGFLHMHVNGTSTERFVQIKHDQSQENMNAN